MKKYLISFEIQVPEDASHPLDWIPESVGDNLRADEWVGGYLCQELPESDLE